MRKLTHLTKANFAMWYRIRPSTTHKCTQMLCQNSTNFKFKLWNQIAGNNGIASLINSIKRESCGSMQWWTVGATHFIPPYSLWYVSDNCKLIPKPFAKIRSKIESIYLNFVEAFWSLERPPIHKNLMPKQWSTNNPDSHKYGHCWCRRWCWKGRLLLSSNWSSVAEGGKGGWMSCRLSGWIVVVKRLEYMF